MLNNLKILKNSASKILAAAAVELFHGALRPLSGGAANGGFYYDFRNEGGFELNPELLLQLEGKMRGIASEKRPISILEMLYDNAVDYVQSQGVHERGCFKKSGRKELASIFKMGSFADFGEPPFLADSKELQFFKLLSFEYLDKRTVRIFGAAFVGKDSLKDYLKALKEYPVSGYRALGVKQKLFLDLDGKALWLPKGLALKEMFASCLKDGLTGLGYRFIAGSESLEEAVRLHPKVKERYGYPKLAEMILAGQSFDRNFFTRQIVDVEYACVPDKDIYNDCISLLQFILKPLKILNFKFKVLLTCKDLAFKRLLEENKIEFFSAEKGKEERVELWLEDVLGRDFEGGRIAICDEGLPNIGKSVKNDNCRILKSSLFGPLEQFAALALENVKGEWPFWAQPEQVRVFPVGEMGSNPAQMALMLLKERGYRASLSQASQGLDKRVYEAIEEMVPYGLFVGESESKTGSVSLRDFKSGNSKVLKLEEMLSCFSEINMRSKEEKA